MPGRFVQFHTLGQLQELYRIDLPPPQAEPGPRYNVAPAQQVTAIRERTRGQREIARLRWGFIPTWKGGPIINARSETLETNETFKGPFRDTRCIVPASGFYEWPARETPHYLYRQDGRPLSFAALWTAQANEAGPVEVVALVTCAPNPFMREMHHRMGVLLDRTGWEAWLDPQTPQEALLALVKPRPWPGVTRHRVSTRVNSVRNDGPACIEPVYGPEAGEDLRR